MHKCVGLSVNVLGHLCSVRNLTNYDIGHKIKSRNLKKSQAHAVFKTGSPESMYMGPNNAFSADPIALLIPLNPLRVFVVHFVTCKSCIVFLTLQSLLTVPGLVIHIHHA